MFRRDVKSLSELLGKTIRDNGLEAPLLHMRTIDAWDEVVGPVIAGMTAEKFIRNQTLYVKITNHALRQDLSMVRSRLLQKIVDKVGSQVVTQIAVI